jgi:hypothetical protein
VLRELSNCAVFHATFCQLTLPILDRNTKWHAPFIIARFNAGASINQTLNEVDETEARAV